MALEPDPVTLTRRVLELAAAARADHQDHEHHDAGDDQVLVIERGILHGAGVEQFPSKRTNRLSVPLPIGVTWHWTATGTGTARTIAKNWQTLPDPDEHVGSAHVILPREGGILQLVTFLRGSWHAGAGSALRFRQVNGEWTPATANHSSKVSANHLFVGVEIENVGEVRKVGGVWLGWPFGNKKHGKSPVVPDDQVVEHKGKHYQAYTEAQVVAARRLLRALAGEYPIGRRGASWGHVDLDPQRKTDPGPLWKEVHLPAILEAVYGAPPAPLPTARAVKL